MAERQTVTEDIDRVIRGGLAVHDASGERIGIDREYGDVFLAVSKDVLLKDYAHMPDGTILRVDAVAPGVDLITGTADERTER